MADQQEDDTKFVGAYIPVEQHDRLVALADANERSVAAELRMALRMYLDVHAEAA